MTSPAEFDLIITQGRIVDGTGNPWFEGDVAIKDGRIAEIGRIAAERGARVIAARGMIVAPGFIDVHTHIEGRIESHPTAENFLRMGVTSVITGNCGGSALPLGEWFAKLEKTGVSINIGSLVGHNTVRHAGMQGDFDRPPTPEELERMRALVEQAMRDGAVGFSTGLEYVPGTYAKTDEIAALAKVAAARGGLYATHMRNEDETVEQSIRESLEIGELAHCPVEISHFKISSKKRWGASAITIQMVEDARARGQQVTVDQYLYPASSTGIGILFPSWLFEGGQEKTKERLQDTATRARVKREMIEKAKQGGFTDFSFAYVASHRANPNFNGKNISEITRLLRPKAGMEEETEQAIEILLAGGAQMVLHKMSDEDVDRIFRQPFTMIASDSGVQDIASDSMPHPRGFGNNARVLGVYVREKKLVGLEDAIRKMTSLPASTFSLWDRGLLRPGMAADIVIFDEKTVTDRATFQQPKQYAAGIAYVIVNGQVVVEQEKYNGARPGRILRGRGTRMQSVYVESRETGERKIQPQKMLIELSQSHPAHEQMILDARGAPSFMLQILHNPWNNKNPTFYESWLVDLCELKGPKRQLNVSKDCGLLRVSGQGGGGDYFPMEDNVGWLYPLEKPEFLKHGAAVYPIMAKRIIKVDSFYCVIQVVRYKMSPQNPKAVDSLEVVIELTNKYESPSS